MATAIPESNPQQSGLLDLGPCDFESIGCGAENSTRASLLGEGYQIVWHVDTALSDSPTARMYDLAYPCGVRFIATHGWSANLIAEAYASEGARDSAWNVYLAANWTAQEMYKVDRIYVDWQGTAVPCFCIGITDVGLVNHVKLADDLNATLTFCASCKSYNLAAAFGGREFLGYKYCADEANYSHDVSLLWDHMTGVRNGGNSRPVGAAYTACTPHTFWPHPDRFWGDDTHEDPDQRWGMLCRWSQSSAGRTTLSPVVVWFSPAQYVQSGSLCSVKFDTYMDTAAASSLIDVTAPPGVAPPVLYNFYWSGPDWLWFSVANVTPCTAYTLRVRQEFARSMGNSANLNGNTDPPWTDGTRPNGDDLVWSLTG